MAAPIHARVSVTGTPQPLYPTSVAAAGFLIKALSNNSQSVYLGAAGVTPANGFELRPGETLNYQADDRSGFSRFVLRMSDFFVVGTAGDSVSVFASPE